MTRNSLRNANEARSAAVLPTSQPIGATSTVVTGGVRTRVFKIIVVGDSGVGKTCLTYRFCGGTFETSAVATIGVDFREKVMQVEDENVKIQLWDTAGQERFRRSMVQHYYRNTHAVVFVYDVTQMATFDHLPDWIAECKRFSPDKEVPSIIIGNKCDCKNRQVQTYMAQRFADSHNMLHFETSAKDASESNHIDAIFMTLALKLKRQRPLLPPQITNIDGSTTINLQNEADTQDTHDTASCFC